MSRIKILLLILFLYPGIRAVSQDDPMEMLGVDSLKTEYTYATFKTTRVVLGQSVESIKSGTLQFLIQHNFGSIDQGAKNFFGLDESTIRLAFEYGITDRLTVGIARSSFLKTFDGSLKYNILRQSSGLRKMPLTVSVYGVTMLNSSDWKNPDRKNYFSSRLSYAAQLLIARKFSKAFSLQLSPTFVHKNLVNLRVDQNNIFAAGLGGRYKITPRTSVNAEYFYVVPGATADNYENCLSIGFDIETGGHVFQLRMTNAQPLFESAFITETSGKWSDQGIYFGFTINRVFTLRKYDQSY